MFSFIEKHLFFIVPMLFFILAGGISLILFPHGQWVLWANEYYSTVVFTAFEWLTKLAEIYTFMAILLILLCIRYSWSFLFSFSVLCSGTIGQFFKKVVFDFPRPARFFEGTVSLNYPEGFAYYMAHSFPSGHTTMAFAMFTMLALFVPQRKWLQFFFFLCALTVGISRVVLMQHFYRDIYAGAILGTMIAIGIFLFFEQKNFNWFASWKQKNILNSIFSLKHNHNIF